MLDITEFIRGDVGYTSLIAQSTGYARFDPNTYYPTVNMSHPREMPDPRTAGKIGYVPRAVSVYFNPSYGPITQTLWVSPDGRWGYLFDER